MSRLICMYWSVLMEHAQSHSLSMHPQLASGTSVRALILFHTVKPVLSGHSKIINTKVLKTNGSLMKVKSIAECSLGAFCNIFDLH